MNSSILRLAGLFVLSACTTAAPSLVIIHTDAELGVQELSGSYTIRVEGRAPGGEFTEEFMESYQGGWGRDLTIGPRGHDASRSYRITLTAFEDPNSSGVGFVRNVLISGYVEGQTRHYDLLLYDACQNAECGQDQLCDERGACMSAEVPPVNLAIPDGGGPSPDVPTSDAGPTTDVPTPNPDAGPGPRDAGPGDAGPGDAGSMGGDAGPVMDAGSMGGDAGPVMDAGSMGRDAGPVMDAGMDVGPMDAGMDAGPMDAGMDAGPMDAGLMDGGPVMVEAGAV